MPLCTRLNTFSAKSWLCVRLWEGPGPPVMLNSGPLGVSVPCHGLCSLGPPHVSSPGAEFSSQETLSSFSRTVWKVPWPGPPFQMSVYARDKISSGQRALSGQETPRWGCRLPPQPFAMPWALPLLSSHPPPLPLIHWLPRAALTSDPKLSGLKQQARIFPCFWRSQGPGKDGLLPPEAVEEDGSSPSPAAGGCKHPASTFPGGSASHLSTGSSPSSNVRW